MVLGAPRGPSATFLGLHLPFWIDLGWILDDLGMIFGWIFDEFGMTFRYFLNDFWDGEFGFGANYCKVYSLERAPSASHVATMRYLLP